MWALWRVHDVFEEGTELDAYPQGGPRQARVHCRTGRSRRGRRSRRSCRCPRKPWRPCRRRSAWLPCHRGRGLPGRSEQPDELHLEPRPQRAVSGSCDNPGFPFFIPGIAGSRPAIPPMDFAWPARSAASLRHGGCCLPCRRRHLRTSGRRSAQAHRPVRRGYRGRRAQSARLQQGCGGGERDWPARAGHLVEQVCDEFPWRNEPTRA